MWAYVTSEFTSIASIASVGCAVQCIPGFRHFSHVRHSFERGATFMGVLSGLHRNCTCTIRGTPRDTDGSATVATCFDPVELSHWGIRSHLWSFQLDYGPS